MLSLFIEIIIFHIYIIKRKHKAFVHVYEEIGYEKLKLFLHINFLELSKHTINAQNTGIRNQMDFFH